MLASEPVNRYMTSVVVSIGADAPAAEILRLFAGYAVHHLPVLSGTKVIGMISSADVLKLEAFLPGRQREHSAESLNRRIRIDQIMRRPAITIAGDESIERAASLMAENGIHALPVTTTGRDLIGIITTTDIMRVALFPARYGSTGDGRAQSRSGSRLPMSPAQMSDAVRLAATAADSPYEHAEIARALLQTQSRLKLLESVLSAADRYIRAGQDDRLHSVLVKAIEAARNSEEALE